MVYPQNGGALEITAQIVAGHPWQENDTLLLPSKWQSWGSSSSWSMDKIWSSRSVALCQFRMFLGKGTTMTVSLIESFHWNKMLCKLPCYLCCLSPSDLVPTRGWMATASREFEKRGLLSGPWQQGNTWEGIWKTNSRPNENDLLDYLVTSDIWFTQFGSTGVTHKIKSSHLQKCTMVSIV